MWQHGGIPPVPQAARLGQATSEMLVRMAYKAMFEQSERFRTALMSTRGDR